MKRLLTAIIMMFAVTISAMSQTETAKMFLDKFKITKDGVFLTDEGKDYTIYQMKDMTAHQIYQTICSNAAKVFVSPKDVMSNVDDVSVSIRAYSDELIWFRGKQYPGYYKLLIEIRDGRVRVSAPIFEGSTSILKDYFDKDGNVKEKQLAYIRLTEHYINETYDKLLGASESLSKRLNKKSDW